MSKDNKKDLEIKKDKEVDKSNIRKEEKGIGFKSKDQIFEALSPQIGDMKRMVKPTLKLSNEALEAPLREGLLSELRDGLTRSGRYANHTINVAEQFVCYPPPGVIFEVEELAPEVIGPKKPVFSSLGFGDTTILPNGGVKCVIHNCPTLLIDGAFCTIQLCPWQICENNSCGSHGCCSYSTTPEPEPEPEPEPSVCVELMPAAVEISEEAFIHELEVYHDHPFVVELMAYFNTESNQELTERVTYFVTRNMHDQSALR